MLNARQIQKIAADLQDINEAGWRSLREFLADRTREAEANATAEAEANRDWWAGHTRYGIDLAQELEELRNGEWHQWAEVQSQGAQPATRKEEADAEGEEEEAGDD